MKVLITFLGITIMIALHEWGHFIAARICKLPVYEFAVGMGPVIKSKVAKSGTKFSLRAIPVGGFCSFDDAKDSGIQDSALNRIPIWQKIFICIAGPLMNLLTGFVIFFMLITLIGVPVISNKIIGVQEGFPAENVLEVNDEIIEIDGTKFGSFDGIAITEQISVAADKQLSIKFTRDGKIHTVNLTPIQNESDTTRVYLGIQLGTTYRTANGFEYISKPMGLTIDYIKQVFDGLISLLTGKAKLSDMSGIVGIISYASEYATLENIFSYATILAVITINLGIMNLLPIPGLDGSKILIGITELICGGKRFPEKIEAKLITVSFVLLIALMFIVTANDLIKIFEKF